MRKCISVIQIVIICNVSYRNVLFLRWIICNSIKSIISIWRVIWLVIARRTHDEHSINIRTGERTYIIVLFRAMSVNIYWEGGGPVGAPWLTVAVPPPWKFGMIVLGTCCIAAGCEELGWYTGEALEIAWRLARKLLMSWILKTAVDGLICCCGIGGGIGNWLDAREDKTWAFGWADDWEEWNAFVGGADACWICCICCGYCGGGADWVHVGNHEVGGTTVRLLFVAMLLGQSARLCPWSPQA